MSAPRQSLLTLLLACLFLAACSSPSDDDKAPTESRASQPALGATAIAENNRGVGLMGRFEYGPAREVFAPLVAQHPQWLDARVNLAIATLNRQQEGDEQAALTMADEVIKQAPGHLRAHYVAGLLRLYLSSPAEALGHFKAVTDGDPRDAYAAYYLGQCLAQTGKHAQALRWYRKALELDPYLRSAYYGAFQALQRLRRRDEARELISIYQRLGDNPRARLAEFKYTRMGPKAEALAVGLANPAPPAEPRGSPFAPAKPVPVTLPEGVTWRQWHASRPASVTVVDLQNDGHPDVFIADALKGQGARNLVLLGRSAGVFTPEFDHPLARISQVNAALWGDFDNDGRTDVYLCRQGPNQLWRQAEGGAWTDVSVSTRTSGSSLNTVGGAFFDADHDGDLDLFLLNADGPNELLNNNRDGTFRPLAAERGLEGESAAPRTALPVDIDRDRDADLLVVNAEPPHEVYVNDRLWAYRPAPGVERFRAAETLAAITGDLDADGSGEIYSLAPDGGLSRWQRDDQGRYRDEPLGSMGSDEPLTWAQLALLDVDGNGVLELLTATSAGWSVRSAEAGVEPLFRAKVSESAELAGITPVLLDPGAGPAVLGLQRKGGLSLWQPGPGRHPYVALSLTGLKDAGHGMRSNASGIGARVALRVGSRWTVMDTYTNHSGPGQSLQPVAAGLGGARRADFIAIDWSDGVFQTELALASGLHRISETQRQLSSCPVLFAWNGDGYAFVSDFLGVGGLGYAVGPGEYATPRPWENVLLPADALRPRKGRLILKVTEPMEEAVYLDAAHLMAYDLPPGWKMALDERMGVSDPPPTGKALFYRREWVPEHVANDRGETVTETVIQADGRAAPVGELDPRFIGRLRNEHVLTLRFDQPLDGEAGEPILVADGWVEYPYSQTMFAAWQADAHYAAPTVEARGADGQWHTVLEQFGYPAGMPRRMSVPLRELPTGARALRIRSNMEVYWDRIAVAFAQRPTDIGRHRLALKYARVAKTGFPSRYTGPQRRPHFDYKERAPFWDTRYMAGYYTRLGPAEDLVKEADDAVAIIGAGEEVHLEFAEASIKPSDGWSRRYVLRTYGWTKDMDLYTQHGDTVGPLPTAGHPSAARQRLHPLYNTRYLAGR